MKLHAAALATVALIICVMAAGTEAAPKAVSDDAVAKPQLFPDAFWEGYKEVSMQVKKLIAELRASNIADHTRTLYADTVAILTPYLAKIRENVTKMYEAYEAAKTAKAH